MYHSGVAKGGPDRAQALPNDGYALPPRLQKDRDTLIKVKYSIKAVSVPGCALPTYKSGYTTGVYAPLQVQWSQCNMDTLAPTNSVLIIEFPVQLVYLTKSADYPDVHVFKCPY